MNFNRDDNSTPIRFTPGREDKFNSANNDVGTRPTGDPKSSKNFQKILRRDPDDKDKEGEEKTDAVDEEAGAQSAMVIVEEQALKKKQATASLFDLSSHASKNATKAHTSPLNPMDLHAEKKLIADSKSDGLAATDAIEDDVTESPSEIYSKMSAKEPKKIEVKVEEVPVRDVPVHVDHPAKVEEKHDKVNSRFATEQPDLSYINPLALSTQPVQASNFNTEKLALPKISIQEIIDQLVEKVVQLETSGRTDTVVTLKRPPILAGADLVVTGFDSAKGEFNITFQKLTQAAKEMLDMRSNQQSLLLALEQKGYAVHIVTNTTLTEINMPTAQASTPQDRNRNQDQPGQEGQQKQPKQGK